MPDLMSQREGELELIVHQRHQLARDVDVAAGRREGVLDRGIEHGEAVGARLNAGISGDAAPDAVGIGRACPGFGAAELVEQLLVVLLRFLDIARVQAPAGALRRHYAGGGRHRGGAEQEEQGTHRQPLTFATGP